MLLKAEQVFSFLFCFVFGKFSRSLRVLVFWYDADRGGGGRYGVGGMGWSCEGVCCVYNVQIIACFSAFSIELKKRRKKQQDKFNTAIK